MQSKLKTNLGKDSDETYCFGLGRNYTKYELNCPIGGHNGTALYVNGKLIELNSLGRTQTQTLALEVEKEALPYNISTNKGVFAPRNWIDRFNQAVTSGKVPEEYFNNKHYNMFTTPPNVYGHSYFNDVQEIINNEDFTIQKFLI